MLRSRQEIIGQIEASRGGGGNQIEALYGAPWHTAALINGIFALAAVLIGGVLLAAYARRADTWPWVKAVALGGVVIGLIGLLVAGACTSISSPPSPRCPRHPHPAPAAKAPARMQSRFHNGIRFRTSGGGAITAPTGVSCARTASLRL